jgi:putative oxygen-independent coproporphyrinogen III oxidase
LNQNQDQKHYSAQFTRSSSTPHFETLPPLALYIHIPWCLKKCPYCDFNSHQQSAEGLPEARYLSALEADLEASLPLVWGRPIHTIFLGGGTPSLLSPEGLDRLLASVRARLTVLPGAEITLEANPGTFEQDRFKAFREAGITRLSLGVQSFQDRYLKALGRVHCGAEALSALESSVQLFERVNVDIMYALPGQTLEDMRSDVKQALASGASHLSCYHLTLEPNTYFHRYPPVLPDEDLSAEMQEESEALLTESGFEHYEVSAYAKPFARAQHNLNYWMFGDYLGIGAGAHGKLSFPDNILRQQRYKQPEQYMQQALAGKAIQLENQVTSTDIGFEFMLNALRLKEGVPSSLFAAHTGYPLKLLESVLLKAQDRGWIESDPTKLKATELGFQYLNNLLELFLPESQ